VVNLLNVTVAVIMQVIADALIKRSILHNDIAKSPDEYDNSHSDKKQSRDYLKVLCRHKSRSDAPEEGSNQAYTGKG
jgi:hypothetical protein